MQIFFSFLIFSKQYNFSKQDNKSLNKIWPTSVNNEFFQKKQGCFSNNLNITALRKYEEKHQESF